MSTISLAKAQSQPPHLTSLSLEDPIIKDRHLKCAAYLAKEKLFHSLVILTTVRSMFWLHGNPVQRVCQQDFGHQETSGCVENLSLGRSLSNLDYRPQ